MKILALVDIHSNLGMVARIMEHIHNHIDLALVLGDLTQFGDRGAREVVESIGADKCYAIPGNLDTWETAREIEAMGISLHGKCIKLGKFGLIGFGGGLFDNPGRVLYSEEQIMESIAPLLQKEKNAILATHMPPKDTALDLTAGGMHVGSISIREAIEKFRPRLHLCGHIHEAAGEIKIGKTRCINIGPAKEGSALLLDLGKNISYKRIKV